LLQLIDPGAENGPRLMVRVRQFVHGQGKHAIQACRLKEDDEGLNCSGQLQSNTPVGLKSDYRDAG
jgi:hypothetical protein